VYDWIHGRPPLLLCESDVPRWPGANGSAPRPGEPFASLREFAGRHALVLREPELTTAVPLELGGVLLVTAVYCDDESAIAQHLEVMPVAGWEVLPQRFRAEGGEYALFDGALTGAQLSNPELEDQILREHGGMLRVALARGEYDVETFGPWRPDARTELWLTRLVRSA
jgi:hypothetical protein